MTSTAIPARLEFQCGHAALVSLPRIKGETSAQRNARIAHEKSAAHARSCDFCAPRLEVHVETVAAPPVEVEAALPQLAPPLTLAEPAISTSELPATDLQPPPSNGTASSRPPRQRRSATPRTRPSSPQLQRFTVRYRVDGVLIATNIRDALRKVESLGATELFRIARDD